MLGCVRVSMVVNGGGRLTFCSTGVLTFQGRCAVGVLWAGARHVRIFHLNGCSLSSLATAAPGFQAASTGISGQHLPPLSGAETVGTPALR